MLPLVVACAITSQIISYVDEAGTTHYVDSPGQIPAKYRKKAKAAQGEVSTVEVRRPTEEERAAKQGAAPDERRAIWRVPQPPATRDKPLADPNSNEERRRKYDEAKSRPTQMKDVCKLVGSRAVCTQMPVVEHEGLKSGESCRSAGSPCAIPPECCTNICNKTTFTCD